MSPAEAGVADGAAYFRPHAEREVEGDLRSSCPPPEHFPLEISSFCEVTESVGLQTPV